MELLSLPMMQGFLRMCGDGWAQGWHERNGGNLSYRLTENETTAVQPFLTAGGDWTPLHICAENLGGALLLVTGSGKYMRNVPLDPAGNIGIVELNSSGDAYRVRWGLEGGAKPTSELPTHVMNQSVRMTADGGRNRVIYHCHPANLTAMTYILPLTDRDFTRALWKSETECPAVFPAGVGVVPWMIPGSGEIAVATAKLMETYTAAVWAQHGLFVCGADFDTAFGLAHTIEKAAEIYLKVVASGQPVRNTISDQALLEIAKAYHVTLNERFVE